MIKSIVSIFLVLLFKFSIAQKFSVCGDKNNVLYIGVDNPLTISVQNYKSWEIDVKVNKGQLIGSNGSIYNYRGVEEGNIIITLYTKADQQQIGAIQYRAKYIPAPVAKLAMAKGEYITAADLKSTKSLVTSLKDFDYNVRFSIDSFKVTVVHTDNCQVKEFTNIGDLFNNSLQEELSKMKKNDILVFRQINVIGPDKISRLLSPVTYIITE